MAAAEIMGAGDVIIESPVKALYKDFEGAVARRVDTIRGIGGDAVRACHERKKEFLEDQLKSINEKHMQHFAHSEELKLHEAVLEATQGEVVQFPSHEAPQDLLA